MYKIAICNISGMPISNNTNINHRECMALCELLNKSSLFDCSILNYGERNLAHNINIFDSYFDINSFDYIIIMGSYPNFFGGENYAYAKNILAIYKHLSKFNGSIFYLFNDYSLPFKQISDTVENKSRSWMNCLKKDVQITCPMYILSQFRNLDNVLRYNTHGFKKDYSNIKKAFFFDFSTWILQFEDFVNNSNSYDLIYGGSSRKGARDLAFEEYFLLNGVNTCLFGSINEKAFNTTNNLPFFMGRVPALDVIKTNSKGFSTIILPEKHYNNNTITLRIYESILANCVVFIDRKFDSNKFINLHDICYIDDGKEFINNLELLKNNKKLLEEVFNKQKQFIEKQKKYNIPKEFYSYILDIERNNY